MPGPELLQSVKLDRIGKPDSYRWNEEDYRVTAILSEVESVERNPLDGAPLARIITYTVRAATGKRTATYTLVAHTGATREPATVTWSIEGARKG